MADAQHTPARTRTRPTRGVRGAGILAATIAALLALAACGTIGAGTGTNTNTGIDAGAAPADSAFVAAAAARVKQATEATAAWTGPTTPVTPAAHKDITVVTCFSGGETCVRVGDGVTEAAKALGWTATVVDGQGQPAVWNQAISSAIAAGTDAIVLAGVLPAAVSGPLEQARAAGIPVIYVLGLDSPLVTATIDQDRTRAAAMTADYIVTKTNAAAHVLLIRDSEFPEVQAYADALVDKLGACTTCTIVDERDTSLALMSQRLPGDVSSMLTTRPEINWVAASIDPQLPFVLQGVRQGAAGRDVGVSGNDGDNVAVEEIRKGSVAATVAVPAEWMGWMAVDDIVRTFAGVPVEHPTVPQRLLTADNAPEAGELWHGDVDYQAEYRKLWSR